MTLGTLIAWELFAAINAGILWCLWTLAREAVRHATWHIEARRERRAVEAAQGFSIVPAQRLPGEPAPVTMRLNRVG
jgi:hypothetical protein